MHKAITAAVVMAVAGSIGAAVADDLNTARTEAVAPIVPAGDLTKAQTQIVAPIGPADMRQQISALGYQVLSLETIGGYFAADMIDRGTQVAVTAIYDPVGNLIYAILSN